MLMIISGGTFGFTILENYDLIDSLYMTIITISTVGFGEIQPLHTGGRIFVILLIVFSLVTGTITLSALGQVIIEGQLRSIMERRKMRTKIKRLSGHYIIAGFGRVGRHVAEAFLRRKVPFIIIEKDNQTLNQIDADGYLYVEGEAVEDEVLMKAGIDRAKALVSTLPGEADNVYLALTARDMNKDLYIIARTDHPDGEKKLKRAGADHVVSPHILGGMRMAMASLRPNVVDFMQMTAMGEGGLGIEDVVLPDNSRFAGKTLVQSNIKADYGVTIIGVKRGDEKMVISPQPNQILNGNDILVLIGDAENLEKFTVEMA